MSQSQHYQDEYHSAHAEAAYRSASVVIPVLLRMLDCRSVVDVGCYVGWWLQAFQEAGVSDVYGIDGSYVDRSRLVISEDAFRPLDLRQPFVLERTFDLAVCLEVANDLPEKSAGGLVSSLVKLAPVVLFSAATPGEDWPTHRNRQWPRYWADLFGSHGFRALDVVRPEIWQNGQVDRWYRANSFLYASEEWLMGDGAALRVRAEGLSSDLTITQSDPELRRTLRILPGLVRKSAKRRVTGLLRR